MTRNKISAAVQQNPALHYNSGIMVGVNQASGNRGKKYISNEFITLLPNRKSFTQEKYLIARSIALKNMFNNVWYYLCFPHFYCISFHFYYMHICI